MFLCFYVIFTLAYLELSLEGSRGRKIQPLSAATRSRCEINGFNLTCIPNILNKFVATLIGITFLYNILILRCVFLSPGRFRKFKSAEIRRDLLGEEGDRQRYSSGNQDGGGSWRGGGSSGSRNVGPCVWCDCSQKRVSHQPTADSSPGPAVLLPQRRLCVYTGVCLRVYTVYSSAMSRLSTQTWFLQWNVDMAAGGGPQSCRTIVQQSKVNHF